ncbi:MAG: hypothetical protein WKF71_14395 [Pyrinomonadaceae bacterium]
MDKLNEGYDVVSGWRKNRQDKLDFAQDCRHRLPTELFPGLAAFRFTITVVSLKAYRRDVIQDVKLYGEMHRFIPIYASLGGRASGGNSR